MSNKNVPNASGYSEAGASLTKRSMKAFLPQSGSPSDDINQNNHTLRQRARMLYMASPIATGAIKTNRTKAVGTGLVLKSTVNRDVLGISPDEAKAWQQKTEAEWRLWAGKKQNCDALAANNFYALQQIALASWLMSGDVFASLPRVDPTPFNPYGLRVQLIEADRVCNPDSVPTFLSGIGGEVRVPDGKPGAGHLLYDGVEVSDSGRVIAYHVCNSYPGTFSTAKEAKWTRVLAFGEQTGLPNILHIMSAERPDQYRGVSYLAQVIEPLLQLRRYTESEIMAAMIQVFFTAWIETEANPAGIPINEVGGGDVAVPEENPETGVSASENEYEMGPGTVLTLKPGEKVHFGNPNVPSTGFEQFVDTFCKMLGAALEIPKDVLLKTFDSSYSASRGALLEAWDSFRMYRSWFVDDFCQPVYEVWLAEAVARGRIKAPGFFNDPLIRDAWCGARWIGPVQGQLDPLKEVKANVLAVKHGFKTHEQVTREMGGGDWEENVEQLQRENELLTAAGINPTDADSDLKEPDPGDGNDGGGDGDGN